MSERSTARVLLETLRNFGVDTLFGIISSHTMEIFDALYDLRDDFRFIGARHEHAAAMMADGYARVTGRPGVVLTSTGPGAANSMGGMGEAYFASSPLLNITSTAEEPLYERGLDTIHETKNQLGMFESVTRHCYHVSRPGDVVGPLCEAFELFHTARPQPIAIQIPVDVQRDVARVVPGKPARTTPPGTDTALVSAAAELLLSGSRVGVLAGTGVHRAGAHQVLTRLVETLQIPVFTTANGPALLHSDRSALAGGCVAPDLRAQCAGLGRFAVGRLPLEQAQHRRAAVRRLRRAPVSGHGQPAGTRGIGGDRRARRSRAGLRSPAADGQPRRDRLAGVSPPGLAVGGDHSWGLGIRHSPEPRSGGRR